MNSFLLSIVTPQRQAYSELVDRVSVPGADGRLTILPRHAKLFAALVEGEIKIVKDHKESFLAIGGGFVDVAKHEVVILVSQAVHAHELNEAEIEKARKSAHELLAKAPQGMERAQAMALLRRSLVEDTLLKRIRRRTSVS